jgi:hypothetical protein
VRVNGQAQIYEHFDDLPSTLRDRIIKEISPDDPEAWARQPIQALSGRSLLETLGLPDGESQVEEYLSRVDALIEPGPHPAKLNGLSIARTFNCSAARADAMSWWLNLTGSSAPFPTQRLIIEGTTLRFGMNPLPMAAAAFVGLGLMGFLGVRYGWPFALIPVAIGALGLLVGPRIPIYDLRTAHVRATEVFPLSTVIDGFEISGEAGGAATLVWSVDVAGLRQCLTDMGVDILEGLPT